jgi:hypothetical protein
VVSNQQKSNNILHGAVKSEGILKRPQFEQEPKIVQSVTLDMPVGYFPHQEPQLGVPIRKVVRMKTDATLDGYADEFEEYQIESGPVRSHPKTLDPFKTKLH